jgi:phosphate transport system ATP-binding protein
MSATPTVVASAALSAKTTAAIESKDLSIYYGDFQAVRAVNLEIEPSRITAIIGPSGCGKSTVLRAFNRMNELIPDVNTTGEVLFAGRNI